MWHKESEGGESSLVKWNMDRKVLLTEGMDHYIVEIWTEKLCLEYRFQTI